MRYVPGSKPLVAEDVDRRPGPRPRPERAGRARTHSDVARRARRIETSHKSTEEKAANSSPLVRWLKPVAKLVARLGMAFLILLVFVFGVFPTSKYVDQRDELDRARIELSRLRAENEELQQQVDRLDSDAEIERVARDRYDMVLPDEDVYAVLPPAGG